MVIAPLVSDHKQPRWEYIKTGLGRTGRSLSENNFAKERRDWLAILLREILQNALDARITPDRPAIVSLAQRALDDSASAWMCALMGDEHFDRFAASLPHIQGESPSAIKTCLVVEDFGTSGLTGSTDNPDLDGKGQNWNAFWFREGEGGKEHTSGNGGAGQGKITYFSTSAIRTIFAYTVRADDNCEALLGACSFLRDYLYKDRKWKRDAYWGIGQGNHEDRIVLPAKNRQIIDSFRQQLGLERNPDLSGLSLVIPSPKEFNDQDALQIIIAEFFAPIHRGDLIIKLDGLTIEKDSLTTLANKHLSDDRARELHTCMTGGYREFLANALARSASGDVVRANPVSTTTQLTENSFESESFLKMRTDLDEGRSIAVRLPVTVKSKSSGHIDCFFDVHLACPFDMDRPEQAVIRRDLLIGEEPIGGGKLRQRARGLTLIGNDELSRLLLAAEEPTHLRWNAKLPRLGEYYKAGPEIVSLVRNAMSRLLDLLTGGEQERDFKLLAKYFSAPGLHAPLPAKGKKSPKGKNIPLPPIDIPPPKAKLVVLEALEDGCHIKPAKTGALLLADLPLDVRVEFAYEGLDKDAFHEYDPLDFDLDDKAFDIRTTGCTVTQRSLNQLAFTILEPDFELQLNGFDKNLRLRMRLSYEEVANAATISTE